MQSADLESTSLGSQSASGVNTTNRNDDGLYDATRNIAHSAMLVTRSSGIISASMGCGEE